MMQRMDAMHDEMFKGFGGAGSLMKAFGDPFKDDPFFNRGGSDIFARADQMMKEMHQGFDSDIGGSGLAKGHFIKQTYHKRGDDVY